MEIDNTILLKDKSSSPWTRKGSAKQKSKINDQHDEPENKKKLIEVLRKTTEKEKVKLVKNIKLELQEFTNKIINAVEKENIICRNEEEEDFNEDSSGKSTKESAKFTFHNKSFQARNSFLTDLFKVNHISTIYHIFIAFLINLFINTAVYDMVKHGKINLGFELIYWNFQSLPLASFIWLIMLISTIGVHFAFKLWAFHRSQSSKFIRHKIWDSFFLLLFIIYVIMFLIIPAFVIMRHRLAIAISFSLLMEQVRFLMKIYAFVRSSTPKLINDRNHKTGKVFVPTFAMFMYFLFAPTLVYRNVYPRTSGIRWNIVFRHFLEIIGVIFYLAFIMENYLIPSVKNFGKTPIKVEELLVIFFNNNVPCVFIFLCGFYSFLHSWMNAFAEILQFADRMFYEDWWNSSSFAEYYKTWNVIVHDWLYTFVYKDGTENLTKKKTASTWMVFIISALFHEYILAFTFKFCYPVLFFVFGIIGTCLVFVPKRRSSVIGNTLLWLGIFTGTGCCGTLYMMEYYARINCPQENDSFLQDFFTPRSWTCISTAIK